LSVSFWRFGGTPVPTSDAAAIGRRLEELGWDGLVVGEDAGVLAEPYVFLSAVAAATTRLRLGTGVSVPLRHPLQAANVALTLNAVSGGRFVPSYGRGDGGLAILGRRPITLPAFMTYVERVKLYLAGDAVDDDGFASTIARMFSSDPSMEAMRPSIDVSATGPKMISFAATRTDGVTLAVGADIARLRQGIDWARAERKDAGLDVDALRISCYIPAAVVVNGDRAAARDTIRGGVLRHARFSAFEGKALEGVAPSDQATVLRAFEATRDHGLRAPKPADFTKAAVIDDDFLERFAIVGEPSECAERFQEIIELGVDRIVVLTRVPGTDPHEDNAARLAQEVFPQLRTPRGEP
jgi:5,10-methylenetetrahydromethanopterin reductase